MAQSDDRGPGHESINSLDRRGLLGLLGSLLLLAPAPTVQAGEKGFPRRVRHMHGETVVSARPQRIACIGLNDQDFAYALGAGPVGVTEWWGNRAFATWPWAEPARRALGAEPQTGGSRFIDYEWVLSLEPDLILATYRDLDARSYAKLSRIAPVIAAPAGYPAWSAPWEKQLRVIGDALGEVSRARAIEEDLRRRTISMRRSMPQLPGKTAALADFREGQFVLWSEKTAPTRFLMELGLLIPKSLTTRANAAGWIHLSIEEAKLMDIDILIWPNDVRHMVENIALFRELPVFAEGRCLWLAEIDDALSAALWFQSPLSIGYLLDRLPPIVESLL